MMNENGINKAVLEEHIWGYFTTFSTMKKMDSHILGEFTRIDDYTTKKGRTFKAHFTKYGNYIGAVSKLGDKPISYKGNFEIVRDKFAVNLKALEGEVSSIADVMEPIPIEEQNRSKPKRTIKVKKIVILDSDSEDEDF